MQLLILSLLIAVASATYPSYYSGYGGYGSSLYGHSYGGSGGHASYVLGDHYSDLSYSHAPRFLENFSKTNTLPSNGGVTKINFVKGVEVAKVDTSPVGPTIQDKASVSPKSSKNETEDSIPNEDDWVDITLEDKDEKKGTHDVEESPVDDTASNEPIIDDFNKKENPSSVLPKETSVKTKKSSSIPIDGVNKESYPSFDSFLNSSDTSNEPEPDTKDSHEPVHEIIKSTASESDLNTSEKLALPDGNDDKKSPSKNRFVPVPDQDYDDFGSKMDHTQVEKINNHFVKQSSIKGGKASAALYSFGISPTLNRSPRKTANFESSAMSSLVSSSDIASFESVDIPLPYYFYKQNQRGELYEHVPTFEYIPNIAIY